MTDEVIAAPRPAERVAPEDDPAPRRRPRYLIPALVGGLAVALIATLALLLLWLQALDTLADDVGEYLNESRGEVQTRVTEVMDLLLNYDSTNFEQVTDRVLEISTGQFREQYEQLIPGPVGEALIEASASSRGQILQEPQISFTSPSQAVSLAQVTQTAQSEENPAGRTIIYQLKITMIKTAEGEWKADGLDVLSVQDVTT